MSAALASLLQLARRWLYCTVCGILTVLFGAGTFYLWHIKVPDKALSAQVSFQDRVTAEIKKNLEDRLKKELAAVREKTKEIEANLVDDADLAANLRYFYNLEEETKVRLPELHPVSSPPTDVSAHYRRVPYGLRVLGTYDQVAAFLLALETGKRLSRITTFSFARTDPSGQAVALDLNVELLGKK
jgi:Tfp pilus assembly protein PilO